MVRTASWSVVVLSIFFCLWKCQFGIDPVDEPFALSFGLKQMALGDLPFRDEVHNTFRHHDLLNRAFLAPWLELDVLKLRILAVGFSSMALLVFVFLCFQRSMTPAATLTFAGSAMLTLGIWRSWDYNSWAVSGVLLHQVSLLFVRDSKVARHRVLGQIAAGFFLGLATVAYNPLLGAFVATFGFAISSKSNRALGAWYAFGWLLPIGADLSYIFSSGLTGDWLESARHSLHGPYDTELISARLTSWGRAAGLNPVTWFFALCPFLVLQRQKVASVALAVFFTLLGIRILRTGPEPVVYLGASLLGIAVSLALLSGSRRKSMDGTLHICASSTFLSMFAASAGGEGPVFAFPLVLVPYVAWLTRNTDKENRQSKLPATVALSILLLLGIATTRYSVQHTLHDASPSLCTKRMQIRPYHGIYTTERRGYLIEQLERLLRPRTFYLSYYSTPLLSMFDSARPASNSRWQLMNAPPEREIAALETMMARGRVPEILVLYQSHPSSWGLPQPASIQLVSPGSVFARCVSARALATEPEYLVFEVDADKIPACLRSL